MEKKPVYESPKVSRLDEKESVLGGTGTALCVAGSGAADGCGAGNLDSSQCVGGSDGNSAVIGP